MIEQLTVPAQSDKLDDVIEFVITELEAEGRDEKTLMLIELAIEESFINIANYAYPDDTGTVTISKERLPEDTIRIVLADSGVPYDPLQRPDPDITVPMDKKPMGGLGIYMTKKSMDKIGYEYRDGHNILTLEKKLGQLY